jgi:thymidylate synthase (FAD)
MNVRDEDNPETPVEERLAHRRRPKLLIIGHARHGKDTVAEMIEDQMGLTFKSSSIFVGEKCVWPAWGKERYSTFDEMFEDRVSTENRIVWGNLISAYNTPNQARTAIEMLAEHDMYVGMRRIAEWQACKDANLFDYVIWVDACSRKDLENVLSNEMTSNHADLYIDNNGPESNLQIAVDSLQLKLHQDGFEVDYEKQFAKISTLDWEDVEFEQPVLEENRLTWADKPENAVTVLDHGFFEVKEIMGSDEVIAGSARMSYGRGTKKKNNDPGLINYLVKNHHTSPLEMGEIRFHMRLPIFVMRQLVRQRTANLNEYSGRYSEMIRLFYTPELAQIMCQGLVNKQMSGEPLPEDEARHAQAIILNSSNRSFDDYEKLLTQDVSRETSRIVLPLNTYTEVVWKLDVSNLMKFLYLRDDDHAQWEIRQYAILIGEAVQHYFPAVYESYLKVRDSVTLSRAQVRAMITGDYFHLSKSETEQVRKLREEL